MPPKPYSMPLTRFNPSMGWGMVTQMAVPGGFNVTLYQPKYVKNSKAKPSAKKAGKTKAKVVKKKAKVMKKVAKAKKKKR